MNSFQSFNSTHTTRFGSGATILRARGNEHLTEEALRVAAPSVFAEGAHHTRSDRYTYIPTINVLRGLMKEGFKPFEVRQGGSRNEEKKGFTKHMLRLRHEGSNGMVAGDSVRELILLNAHDGTSSYQLMSGLFRIVCTNGLITCEDGEMQRIPHKGDIISNVIDGAYHIIDQGDEVRARTERLRLVNLNTQEQEAFASAALELRFNDKDDSGNVKQAPVQAYQVNRSRREADNGADLWRTFNRVQENLMDGGQAYRTRTQRGTMQHRHTRPVNSIDGNVTLNRALWVLANKMAELKAA